MDFAPEARKICARRKNEILFGEELPFALIFDETVVKLYFSIEICSGVEKNSGVSCVWLIWLLESFIS